MFMGAVFLALLLVGLYAFIDARKVDEGTELGEDVVAVGEELKESVDPSMASLKAINNELVGWVTLDGTHIDYPVAQGKDNSKYLTRDYRGKFSTAGSAFLDYRNDGFNDAFTVIYGHRMREGQMFSDIAKYADKNYFNSHLTGSLIVEGAKYKIDVVGFAVVNVASTRVYDVEKNRNNVLAATEPLERYYSNRTDIKLTAKDKVLLFSTCDKDTRYKRDILLVKLTKL